MTQFSENVIEIIQSIPPGSVMTYGEIAEAAGNHRAARQVSRLIHSCTKKYKLPWHRVVGKGYKVTIPDPRAATLQKELLAQEGYEI